LSSPLSSLNSSGASSAFSTPAQQHQNNNITNLSTLTTALFAADKVVGENKPTKDFQIPQNLLNRRLSGSRSVAQEVFLILFYFFKLEDFLKT